MVSKKIKVWNINLKKMIILCVNYHFLYVLVIIGYGCFILLK